MARDNNGGGACDGFWFEVKWTVTVGCGLGPRVCRSTLLKERMGEPEPKAAGSHEDPQPEPQVRSLHQALSEMSRGRTTHPTKE
mmetsp:Transcript_149493/g.261214  ORF Transcript_149493/g.261214 Transcript_149493/m.261214 type:complete len:84 (-) Transcript_149493:34-285(-)